MSSTTYPIWEKRSLVVDKATGRSCLGSGSEIVSRSPEDAYEADAREPGTRRGTVSWLKLRCDTAPLSKELILNAFEYFEDARETAN